MFISQPLVIMENEFLYYEATPMPWIKSRICRPVEWP